MKTCIQYVHVGIAKKKEEKKEEKKKEEKKIQILKFITEFKTILEVLYWWCFNILQKMKYVHID